MWLWMWWYVLKEKSGGEYPSLNFLYSGEKTVIEKRRKGIYCFGEKNTRRVLVCKRKIFLAVLEKIYDDSRHFGLLFDYVHCAFIFLADAIDRAIAYTDRTGFGVACI